MNFDELSQLLQENSENEHIEFKEASNTFPLANKENRKSVLGYAVGIGNEGGGRLILGVTDKKKIVGTKAFPNLEEVKSKIYSLLKARIEIEEIVNPKNPNIRVLIIQIPPRPLGQTFKFYGTPLMRVGAELTEMDDQTLRNILSEHRADFSSQPVLHLKYEDLSQSALEKMQLLFNKKNNTNSTPKQLLDDLQLKTSKGITYAALILLGNEIALKKYLPNAEIIFQYRREKDDINYADRKDFRNAFLLEEGALWEKVTSRNEVLQVQSGLFTQEIASFNEKVIKEAILNAITHRDYEDPGSITIKQSPQEFEIQSPGGFLPGITIENILNQTKPRNRLIAETLQHLGFIQRAGQGMDTIFSESITEGKGVPDLSESTPYQITLKISAQVKNINFLKYVIRLSSDRQLSLSLSDLIFLQSVEKNGRNLKKAQVQKFIDNGLIEFHGKTKGIKYTLSHNYYTSQGKPGTYTHIVGISRSEKKLLIEKHLKNNKKGAVLEDLTQAFRDISRHDISNLLQELKREGIIKVEGKNRWAKWKLNT